MDNTGPYIKYDELIVELFLTGSVAVKKIGDVTLSSKTPDGAGAIFEYTPVTPAVKIGDVVNQLGRSAIVIAILTTPDRLQVEDLTDGTTDLSNGSVEILRSDKVPRFRGEDIIGQAMNFIDEQTGQFFNSRAAIVKLEGNNTPTMWFPVPIIDIQELLPNSSTQSLDEGVDGGFIAFKGRAEPQDDRRNPRIKLNLSVGQDSIFTTGSAIGGIFVKQSLTKITGDFGFLEPDGSTPALIRRATTILAAKEINSPAASASATTGTGPVKRTKVDLHEKEFFELKSATARGSLSGIPEVDQIISRFRTAIRLGGSIQLLTRGRNQSQRVTVFT